MTSNKDAKIPDTTLNQIASNIYHDPTPHSNFMHLLASAYILADKENRDILRPTWIIFLKKTGYIKEDSTQ